MSRTLALFGAVALFAALAGCATVARGPNEVLRIKSNPSGAQVQLSNGMSCETPCALRLPRQSEVTVTVTRFNCEMQQVRVRPVMGGRGTAGLAGNLLVPAGMVGVAVDGATGAAFELAPNPVEVTLSCFREPLFPFFGDLWKPRPAAG